MKQLFADSSFWIALLYTGDEWHATASELMAGSQGNRIVTSDFVCLEVLNHAAGQRTDFREQAGAWADSLKLSYGFMVVRASPKLFDEALGLYRNRRDKAWSFVDCSSFQIMQQLKISEALTADHHFEQAGFNILLK